MQTVSASDVPSKAGVSRPRPLKVDEIDTIVEKFAASAARAKAAGFDGVEVQCGHAYLLCQFLSPLMNHRQDEFGGSPENRARFATLVMKAVRDAVGPGYPVFARISADEFVEGGNALKDMEEIVQFFAGYVDVFDVSAGIGPSRHYMMDVCVKEDGWRSYMARAIKEATGRPTIAMGNIRDPRIAEEILARGDADLIGMGRTFIADPDWVKKVLDGREEELRKCISCNIGCIANRANKNLPLRCTVNPDVIGEESRKRLRISRPCNVVVVGGGTAGLEAACTAAETGCHVTLFEKEERLGGLAAKVARLPAKRRLNDLVQYLIHWAERLEDLDIMRQTAADMERIEALCPDIIVNAAGAQPFIPPIPGLPGAVERGKIETVLDLIREMDRYPEDMAGAQIVVMGGGAVGMDVAEFFSQRNARITLVEMMPELGNGVEAVFQSYFKELSKKHQMTIHTNTKVMQVLEGELICAQGEKIFSIPYDYGFACLGFRATSGLLPELEAFCAKSGCILLNIGDSFRARRIIEGTSEAHDILYVLEQEGFLE